LKRRKKDVEKDITNIKLAKESKKGRLEKEIR
jgi:hypothetical protein